MIKNAVCYQPISKGPAIFCVSNEKITKNVVVLNLSNAGSKKKYDGLDLRSITTLGESLTEKGYFWAGQFCSLKAK